MRALVLAVLAACSFPRPADVSGGPDASPDVAITGLRFAVANNPQLQHDIVATITGTSIDATGFEVDPSTLAPTFETTGTEVDVGQTPQVSGETRQNFTEPVEYTARSADGRDATYRVALHLRKLAPILLQPVSGATCIAVGDLDGDGLPEVVYGTIAGFVVEHNTGTSNAPLSFAAIPTAGTFGTNVNAVAIALADVDGDGRLDVVIASAATTNALYIFANTTTTAGAIAFATTPYQLDVGAGLSTVAVADLNNDGHPDIAVANLMGGGITVAMNKVTPAFAFETPVPIVTGSMPRKIAIARVDGDAKPDLVVTNSGDSTVSVLLNTTADAGKTIATVSSAAVAAECAPDQLAVANLAGDVRPDVAIGCTDSSEITILTQPFGPTPPTIVPVDGAAHGVMAVDLDDDGEADLVAATNGLNGGELQPFIADGTGKLLRAPASGTPTLETGRTLLGADFDHDGLPDFAVLFGTGNIGIVRTASN